MYKLGKYGFTGCLLLSCCNAHAGFDFELGNKDKLSIGGYIKLDARYLNGNVIGSNEGFWGGSGSVGDISKVKFSANESRFNTKYTHGDVTGFIEMDFYGGGGNEVISNSAHPRLRQAYVKYGDILAGQAWSTFVNTSAFFETADFSGPIVACAIVRQSQIRYSLGNLQLALENPESDKGDPGSDSIPDLVAKYQFKGDWGNVAISTVARQLNTDDGQSHGAFGYGITGRINTFGKDDFRFQIHGGETGRYVGSGAVRDLVNQQVEQSHSFAVAYRHFWTDDTRSTFFYGNTKTDMADANRSHWGLNLFKNYTPQLSFAIELGQFEMKEVDADTDYVQLSVKYVL